MTRSQNKKAGGHEYEKNIGSQLALLYLHGQHTYVEEQHLDEAGKIDYRTLKPVLFEFPTYEYLKTGEVIGKCLSFKNGESI